MTQGQGQAHHTSTHTATRKKEGVLNSAAKTEHKLARDARKVDSKIYEAQVLTSGDPKRIERYFLRRFAYRMFGKLMGKTINRI